MDYIIPLFIVVMGVISLTIYCLTVALRDAVKRISCMNERLMVLLGTRDGGPEVGRALVASKKPPKKETPGVVKKNDKKQSSAGLRMTVGAR